MPTNACLPAKVFTLSCFTFADRCLLISGRFTMSGAGPYRDPGYLNRWAMSTVQETQLINKTSDLAPSEKFEYKFLLSTKPLWLWTFNAPKLALSWFRWHKLDYHLEIDSLFISRLPMTLHPRAIRCPEYFEWERSPQGQTWLSSGEAIMCCKHLGHYFSLRRIY